MNKQELIEQLADKEHASWAHWMSYLFSKCNRNESGELVIPESLIWHWQRQIDTPYAQLSEREKQSDRDEVAQILPIIEEYTSQEALIKGVMTIYANPEDALRHVEPVAEQDKQEECTNVPLEYRIKVLENKCNDLWSELFNAWQKDITVREDGKGRTTLKGKVDELCHVVDIDLVKAPWHI